MERFISSHKDANTMIETKHEIIMFRTCCQKQCQRFSLIVNLLYDWRFNGSCIYCVHCSVLNLQKLTQIRNTFIKIRAHCAHLYVFTPILHRVSFPNSSFNANHFQRNSVFVHEKYEKTGNNKTSVNMFIRTK